MISAWWLILVIPLSVAVGYGLCGMLSGNAQADQCANCQYNCFICKKKDKEAN